MTFNELQIDPRILAAITEMGFETPTAVQEEVIPFLLAETEDLVALAQTGTGKTAAFGIPLLQKIDPSSAATQGLILAPTRELCLQITEELKHFARDLEGIRIAAIYGGAGLYGQIKQLEAGAQIVVATPGRMLDLLNREKADLSAIRWLILDEADEMMTMGFKEDLNAILSATPRGKRVLLFSATMAQDVEAIARSYMKEPKAITVGAKNRGAEKVDHQYCVVPAKDRYAALKRIVDANPDLYGIVFCRTKQETQEIASDLVKDGYNADALHGDLSQAQRDHVMKRFRRRSLQMLVATDVAARGIDVTDLTHIINYNLPDAMEHYTHRSGRTGRAGKSGISIVIVNLRELYKIRLLEKRLGKKFAPLPVPSGKEICERQLRHLVEKVKHTEIREESLAPFLETLYEPFQGMSREEIIQRFVAARAGRLLNDYRHAPDLNVAAKQPEPKQAALRKSEGREAEAARREGGKSGGPKAEARKPVNQRAVPRPPEGEEAVVPKAGIRDFAERKRESGRVADQPAAGRKAAPGRPGGMKDEAGSPEGKKKEGARSPRIPRVAEAAQAAPTPPPRAQGQAGLVRLVINLGLTEGFTPPSLATYLAAKSRVANLQVRNVEIQKSRSYLETDVLQAAALIGAFERVRFRHRPVYLEPAGPPVREAPGRRGPSRPGKAPFPFPNRQRKPFAKPGHRPAATGGRERRLKK